VARILLVEDQPQLLAMVAKALEGAGHIVTAANRGADAICRLTESPPFDLIVLDLLMPNGFDGHKVLQSLGPAGPPVIVASGADVIDDDFKSGHVKRVISKPYEWSELLAAVNDVLGRTGQ
jgi:CheY-like chemotaxis protein